MTDDPDEPTARRKNAQREWRSQEVDKHFLDRGLPEDAYWTAFDQGRAPNRIIGALRKKRGMKSGIPDLFILWRGISLWIERKVVAADSELGTNQRLTAQRLIANGHFWARANNTEEVEAAIRKVGIPLRATLGEIRQRIEAQNERLPAKRKKAARGIKADNGMSMAQYRRLNSRQLI